MTFEPRTPTFPPPTPDRSGAIVLVHGAWVGEWCWEPIASRLRDHGRRVEAVSLTGHGRRRHQSGPHITLSDHAADLVAVLETADLLDATVVAHSYGGRVVSKAWPAIAARASRLVFLDAHAPLGDRDRPEWRRWERRSPGGGLIPVGDYTPNADELGGSEALAWFLDRCAPQSLATLTESFWTTLPAALDKLYVRAAANTDDLFDSYATAAAQRPDWGYVEIDAHHWLLYSHPDAVVAAICGEPHPDHRRVRPQETTT